MDIELVAEGLKFPEGPIAMADGSVILTEIAGQRLSRITPDGKVEVYAETGGGPNGETLYAAEWVREPTKAELSPFMPARQESGWGIIACRTVGRNRVEDCREMGETPGSGIARGLGQFNSHAPG
jgi:hypothetical protein